MSNLPFPRCIPIKQLDTKKDVIFQATSWYAIDHQFDGEDGEKSIYKYLVKVFGVTEEGNTVSVNLLDFPPYFFIKVPHSVTDAFLTELKKYVYNQLWDSYKPSFKNIRVAKMKDFWGFQNYQNWSFVRFTFGSLKVMRAAARCFEKPFDMGGKKYRYKLYESNIEPVLRLMHNKNVQPTGWIKIPGGYYHENDDILRTTSQIDINCKWNCIEPVHKEKIAPMMVMSFDLECVSSHGDFPVASKDYKKVANDLLYLARGVSVESDSEDESNNGLNECGLSVTYIMNELINSFHHDKEGKLSKVFYKKPYNVSTIPDTLKPHGDTILGILKGTIAYDPKDETYLPTTSTQNKDAIIKSLTARLNSLLPKVEGDPIIQIGVTVHCYGDRECTYRHIITLNSCTEIPGVTVEQCTTEKELLIKFRDLLVSLDPDVVTGYNILGFDINYLYDRACELGAKETFTKIGRIKSMSCEYVEKKLSSSALGDNILKYIDMPGRVIIDVMKVVQRDHKLDSYKLDNVANHFMKMNKHDVSPNDIFRLYRGNADDRKVIAEYCIQDCALCNNLIMKLEILANNIGMSNVCHVPLSYIFMRGQGIKIFSLVAKECREDSMCIPTISRPWRPEGAEVTEEEEGYEGAIVLEPKVGIYLEDPVSVFDYASLYPSSMISENISHDMIVLDPKYDNLPEVEYLDITYDLYEGSGDKKKKSGERVCRFVQPPNNEKGIIPRILMKLLKARKDTRKKIEYQTLTLYDGKEVSGLVSEDGENYKVSRVDGTSDIVSKSDVVKQDDTYDDFQKAVLDGLQLAYKITANSLYGQCGARTSSIYMKDIAACTTATGRKMIMIARDYILKHYEGSQIVYGDSVTGDTPLLLRYPDGSIDIRTIETLSEEWQPYENFKPFESGLSKKEQGTFNAEVWSNGQWATIKRVIRHYTDKKLYRVNSFRGCVDVTEDHSLISAEGEKVKPYECMIGVTKLMHSFPTEFPEGTPKIGCYESKGYNAPDTSGKMYLCNITQIKEKVLYYNVPSRVITKEEAWVWGLFFGDGSCGKYDCKSGAKTTWAINNSNTDYLNRAREYLLMCEPKEVVYDFKINDTIESSGVYKLIPNGSQDYMVKKYRALFYDKDKYKKVPKIILNAPLEVRKWFMDGYLTADGAKAQMSKGDISFDCKGKIGAQGLYYIAKSCGWTYLRVKIRESKDNIYRVTNIKNPNYYESDKDLIKKMHPCQDIPYSTYVYDIETSCGKFHAGVGETVVSNTDSLFSILPIKDDNGNPIKGKKAIPYSRALGIKISKEIKKIIKPPHDLEWEKIFYPFILFSKKRYCANKYEHDDHKFKQTSMGIVLKRRDNANIVKKIYGGCIDTILNEHDIKKSVEFLKQSIEDLVAGKFPIEDLIVTKSLKSNYKDPTKIAHKVLAERMGERDPGNKPQVNDRIPYVYVQQPPAPKGTKILQGDRIEHPDFIRKMELKPDYEFYLTNQISTPVCQLYSLCLDHLDGYDKPANHWDEVVTQLIEIKKGDMKKVRERLSDLKEKEVHTLLFKPVLDRINPPVLKVRKTATKRTTKKKQKLVDDDLAKDLAEETVASETQKRISLKFKAS